MVSIMFNCYKIYIALSSFVYICVTSYSVQCCSRNKEHGSTDSHKSDLVDNFEPIQKFSHPWHFHEQWSKMHIDNKWFKDKTNRVRLFHGWNAVTKGPPWYSPQLLNETRLRLLQSWGFNAVRLGAMWAGAEPTEGEYDRKYLKILEQIVHTLKKFGIYVLLDMHQDVLSSRTGSYDGVPKWLIDKMPPLKHQYPWPLTNITQWAEGYLAEATGVYFQNIYNNTKNCADNMADYWVKLASIFKHHDNILGYELINEPWAGDIYTDPNLLLPGVAGKTNLMPLYNRINAAVRNVDNDTLIFYEPVTWGVIFNGKLSGNGFDSVPGGPAYSSKSVYSYHYYCWIIVPHDTNKTDPPVTRTVCDKFLGPQVFSTTVKDVSRMGGGSFLTEFGICDPDGSKNSTNTVECTFVMDTADKFLQSWTYWDSQFFDSNGNVNWKIVNSFSRPYAKAIAGTPVSMSFDINSLEFVLQFKSNGNCRSYTEIFIPSVHYNDIFYVTVTSDLTWKYRKQKSTLYVRSCDSSRNKDSNHTTLSMVKITIK